VRIAVMNLTELVVPETVVLDRPLASKEEAITVAVDILAEAGFVERKQQVVRALLERERIMSTGIGNGIAIPHAQSQGVKRLALAILRSKEGVDFDALDGKPVRLILVIVGPEERGGFIRVLARVSRLLQDGHLQKRILKARTPEEVVTAIAEEETKLRR
jgi:fructose-specific phosphotransferase system IIA component